MRILLLNPPGDQPYLRDYYCSHTAKAHYFWHPYDLVVQSGILSRHHEVLGLDANVLGLSFETARRRVFDLKPEGILLLTGAASWRNDFAFMDSLDLPRSVPVVASGDLMLSRGAEYIHRIPWLTAALNDFTSDSPSTYFDSWDRSINGVKNGQVPLPHIQYQTRNGVVDGPEPRNKDFSFPLPRMDIFPMNRYRIPHGKQRRFWSTLTDFGCPFHCSFCVSGTLPYKTRDIDNIMQELRYVRDLGYRELWVKDVTFGVNRKHTQAFLQDLEKESLGFSWVALSRVDVVNEELLQLMARTGCHTIQLGVESADEKILDSIDKQIRPERVKEIFQLCRKLKIRTLAHFIIGLPGETEESAQQTIEFSKELDPDFASFNIATPKVGTPLRSEAIERGWTDPEVDTLDNSTAFPAMEIGSLSSQRVWELRNQAIREFHLRPHYLIRKAMGVRTPWELYRSIQNAFVLLRSTCEHPKKRGDDTV
ncbi:MAG: radical SAM protein [bacterium]